MDKKFIKIGNEKFRILGWSANSDHLIIGSRKREISRFPKLFIEQLRPMFYLKTNKDSRVK